MFTVVLFIIGRSWKEPRCHSIEEWIQKMWYIYTMESYLAIKNNEFMTFLGKRMELENIILGEVTQSQKNTHGMHSLISRYYPRSCNKHDPTHRSNEAQEEERTKYPYSCLS